MIDIRATVAAIAVNQLVPSVTASKPPTTGDIIPTILERFAITARSRLLREESIACDI
jgi:hypothetical protein